MNKKIIYLFIARLYGGLLYAVDIKVLTIENTPLKKVEAQTFLGVNKTLEELNIINTELENFPREAFEVNI